MNFAKHQLPCPGGFYRVTILCRLNHFSLSTVCCFGSRRRPRVKGWCAAHPARPKLTLCTRIISQQRGAIAKGNGCAPGHPSLLYSPEVQDFMSCYHCRAVTNYTDYTLAVYKAYRLVLGPQQYPKNTHLPSPRLDSRRADRACF